MILNDFMVLIVNDKCLVIFNLKSLIDIPCSSINFNEISDYQK